MSRLLNVYKRYDVAFERGKGVSLFDKDGNEYIDFTSGISVVNLGHCNDEINTAIYKQAATLIHTSNLFINPLQEKLATVLSDASIGGDVFFCNSGAEAGEAAIKLARIYGNKKYDGLKYKVISMKNSFHGRSFATLSVTGQEKIRAGFEPVLDFIRYVPINDIKAFYEEAKDDDVVAVIIEVIQGEGGVIPASESYLERVRSYCSDKDIILIFDEVQTGMGRTGALFGYQHYKFEPDVITVAKALANGIPMGAMVAKKQFGDYLTMGTHGSTFGGNYLACSVALKVLEIINNKEFLCEIRKKGEYLKKRIGHIVSNIGEVRGEGLMLGMQLEHIESEKFIKKCIEKKLLVIPSANNTVRLYPPLTVSFEELDEGCERISSALGELF